MNSCPVNGRTGISERTADPQFFARLNIIVESIRDCGSVYQAADLLCAASNLIGADAASFCTFIKNDDSSASFRSILNCDNGLMKVYEDLDRHLCDPYMIQACARPDPFHTHELGPLSGRQAKFVEDIAQYGFNGVYTIPCHSSYGSSRIGFLSLGSSDRNYFKCPGETSLRIAARAIAMEFYEWFLRTLRMEIISSARLTDGDIDLLRHESKGMGSNHIASLLGVTPAAIDSMFQRISVKLRAQDRTAAVRIAAEAGLV